MKHVYKNILNKVVSVLKVDVSYRFIYLNGVYHSEIYKYHKNENQLTISKTLLVQLKQNERDLYDLINYRWGLILENFNTSPRINKKVKIMDERKIKRSPLKKFKKYLDLENPNHHCFICDVVVKDTNISIDHVIPWSYMYSDDIWNLVFVCQNCNSKKSNRIPTQQEIEKLKERNMRLQHCLLNSKINDKIVDELKLANEKDYVTKFWVGSKN